MRPLVTGFMPEIRDRRSDGDRASIGFQAFVMLAVIPKVACVMPSQGRLGGAPRRQNGSMARRPSKRCYVDTIAAVRRLSGNDGFATGQSCAGSIDYRRAWQFENESRLHRLDAMAARSRRECNDDQRTRMAGHSSIRCVISCEAVGDARANPGVCAVPLDLSRDSELAQFR